MTQSANKLVKRCFQLTTTRLILLVMFFLCCGSLCYAGSQSVKTTTAENCPKSPGTPLDPIFQNINAINFHLVLPPFFLRAIQCHSREDACIQVYKDNQEQHKIRIIEEYKSIPEELLPENLTRIFLSKIRDKVLPYVQSLNGCEKAQVNIIGPENVHRAVNKAGTLTISLVVSQEPDLDGKGSAQTLAILRTELFRPDTPQSYSRQVLQAQAAIAIPFDLSAEEISARLKYLVEHSQLNIETSEEWIP